MTRESASRPGLLITYGNWIFKTRNWVFPLALLALLAGFRPVPLGGDPALDIWLDAAGVAVALLGSAYRAWSIGLAYIKRGGVNRRVYADDLVTAGMFGVCRNPLYVGNALVLLGLFIIHNNPFVYLLGGLGFGVSYLAIVTAEETYLRGKFGPAYDAYCARVNRFLPDFALYRESARGLAFNWRRPVTKDHGSIYVWIAVSILLMLYERWAWSPAGLDANDVGLGVAALLVATAAWGLVRVAKKAGAFEDPDPAAERRLSLDSLWDFRAEAAVPLLMLPVAVLAVLGSAPMMARLGETGEAALTTGALALCLAGLLVRVLALRVRGGRAGEAAPVAATRWALRQGILGDGLVLVGIAVATKVWWLVALVFVGVAVWWSLAPGRPDAAAARPAPADGGGSRAAQWTTRGLMLRVAAVRLAQISIAFIAIEAVADLVVEGEIPAHWVVQDLPALAACVAGLLAAAAMWRAAVAKALV